MEGLKERILAVLLDSKRPVTLAKLARTVSRDGGDKVDRATVEACCREELAGVAVETSRQHWAMAEPDPAVEEAGAPQEAPAPPAQEEPPPEASAPENAQDVLKACAKLIAAEEEALDDEKALLEQTLAEMSTRLEDVQKLEEQSIDGHVSSLDEMRTALETAFAQLQKETEAFQEERQTLREELAEEQKALAEEQERLRDALKQTELREANLRTLAGQLGELRAQVEKMRLALEVAHEDLSNEQKRAAVSEAALEETIAGLEQEKADLAGERDALQAQLTAVEEEKTSVEGERSQLQEQVSALEQAQNALKEEAGSITEEQEALRDECETLRAQIAELEQDKTALEQEKSELEEAQANLAKSNAALEKNVTEAQQRAAEQERAAQASSKQNTALQAQLEEARGEAEGLRQERTKLVAQLEATEGGAEALTEVREQLEAETAKLREKLAAAEQERNALSVQAPELEAKIEELQQALEALEAKFEEAEARAAEAQSESGATASKADEAAGKAAQLEEELKKLRANSQRVEQERALGVELCKRFENVCGSMLAKIDPSAKPPVPDKDAPLKQRGEAVLKNLQRLVAALEAHKREADAVKKRAAEVMAKQRAAAQAAKAAVNAEPELPEWEDKPLAYLGSIPGPVLVALARWAGQHDHFEKRDREFLFQMSRRLADNLDISYKQDRYTYYLFKEALKHGFKPETVQSAQRAPEDTPIKAEPVSDVKAVPGPVWLALSRWANKRDQFEPRDRGFLFQLGQRVSRGDTVAADQARYGIRLYNQAIRLGFDISAARDENLVPKERPGAEAAPPEPDDVPEGADMEMEDVPEELESEHVVFLRTQPPEMWSALVKWAKEENLLQPGDRAFVYKFEKRMKEGQEVELDQAERAHELFKWAVQSGFEPPAPKEEAAPAPAQPQAAVAVADKQDPSALVQGLAPAVWTALAEWTEDQEQVKPRDVEFLQHLARRRAQEREIPAEHAAYAMRLFQWAEKKGFDADAADFEG